MNQPDSLLDVDMKPDPGPALMRDSKDAIGTRYHLRRSIRASPIHKHQNNKKCKKVQNKKNRERSLVVLPFFLDSQI